MATYRGTGSMGMIRGCRVGGTSEHKDGRAFDWRADVRRPRQKRAAYDFIAKALAADAHGNAHVLARRMGIMYFIYNDRIWSYYRDFAPRPYLNSGCKKRKLRYADADPADIAGALTVYVARDDITRSSLVR
jgi:hypothetical protein